MSERIFEWNGLYVTSVALPNHRGPALQFCSMGIEPGISDLEGPEVQKLVVALMMWLFDRDRDRWTKEVPRGEVNGRREEELEYFYCRRCQRTHDGERETISQVCLDERVK